MEASIWSCFKHFEYNVKARFQTFPLTSCYIMKNEPQRRDENVFDLNDQDLKLFLPWQETKLLHIFPVVLLLYGVTIIFFFFFS